MDQLFSSCPGSVLGCAHRETGSDGVRPRCSDVADIIGRNSTLGRRQDRYFCDRSSADRGVLRLAVLAVKPSCELHSTIRPLLRLRYRCKILIHDHATARFYAVDLLEQPGFRISRDNGSRVETTVPAGRTDCTGRWFVSWLCYAWSM